MTDPRTLLERAILALGPYLDELVLAGGFVPVFYRCAEWAAPVADAAPTFDIDWVAPTSLPVQRVPLREALESGGFVVIQDRGTRPPIQRFQPVEQGDATAAPAYLEFLTPLLGPATDRAGRPNSPVEIQSRVHAQALR